MASRTYSHQELIEHATLTEEDIWQIQQCRRSHNRLGFAYQIGFARLKNRFPEQQPFETVPDLLTFVGVQLKIDPNEIHKYTSRQQTISGSAKQVMLCGGVDKKSKYGYPFRDEPLTNPVISKEG